MNGYLAYAATNDLVDDDDKPKILLKVYKGLIDKLEIVKCAINERDYKKKYEELSRITMVLELLNNSLDRSQGEIAKNLSDMYGYLIRRLNEVHATMNIDAITESEEVIRKMLEGFTAAYENLRSLERKTADRSQV